MKYKSIVMFYYIKNNIKKQNFTCKLFWRKIKMVTKVFDNLNDIVCNDMVVTIGKGSKVNIAAACFSMYAYKELKKQLEQIDK